MKINKLFIVFLSCLFIMDSCKQVCAQGDLSRFSYYSSITNGKDYFSAKNSLRVKRNQTKSCEEFSFKVVNGKIDSTLEFSIYYYKSGYDSLCVYPGRKPSPRPPDLLESVDRDSVVIVGDSIIRLKANSVIEDKDGFCRRKTWYNEKGYAKKIKSVCGFITFDRTNIKYELKYNEKMQLTKSIKLRGMFSFILKQDARIEYLYNLKDEIIAINYLNKKGEIVGGSKFHYRYWE